MCLSRKLFILSKIHICWYNFSFSSVQFSRSVGSDSLQPHELQHIGPPCPSPTPRVYPTHVHWVSDAIQLSHPLSSPSPPALNLSQHQGLFQWVSSLHQVAKVLEFQLQHQSFQWILRNDFLSLLHYNASIPPEFLAVPPPPVQPLPKVTGASCFWVPATWKNDGLFLWRWEKRQSVIVQQLLQLNSCSSTTTKKDAEGHTMCGMRRKSEKGQWDGEN